MAGRTTRWAGVTTLSVETGVRAIETTEPGAIPDENHTGPGPG